MLALLGVVYDVSRGKEYYGPGGGYSFFAGRDASRAYVTGKFEVSVDWKDVIYDIDILMSGGGSSGQCGWAQQR